MIEELSKSLDEKYIVHTNGKDTGRKYNTAGYPYQIIVDRLNEVLGFNWDFDYAIVKELTGTWGQYDSTFYEVVVKTTIKVYQDEKTIIRTSGGGHKSDNYGDALKGALTTSIKKNAALFGVGREAFANELDEDYQPVQEENKGYGKGYSKVNFDDIQSELQACKSLEELQLVGANYKELNMSDKQRDVVARMYKANLQRLNGQDDIPTVDVSAEDYKID